VRAPFGIFASTPILLNETVYLQDLNSNVYALDRSSGKLVWRHAFNKPSLGPNGVAYGWGRIVPWLDLPSRSSATRTSFGSFAKGRGGLTALAAASGRVVWERKLPQMNVGAATVANDVVFTSTFDGTIYGLDTPADAPVPHNASATTARTELDASAAWRRDRAWILHVMTSSCGSFRAFSVGRPIAGRSPSACGRPSPTSAAGRVSPARAVLASADAQR
jgi:hypothetical protein